MTAFLSSCLAFLPGYCSSTEISKDIILHQNEAMQLIVPSHSLSHDSVRIESKRANRFADWNRQDHQASYELLQKVAHIWSQRGIEDYLVIGRETSEGQFGWDMVPFSKEETAFWKQLTVMKRVFFGEMERDKQMQAEVAQEFEEASNLLDSPFEFVKESHQPGTDPFCNPLVIEKQKVIDLPEESVRVLYDYRPFTYYHFLAVPKEHEEKFSQVPLESYIEASLHAQELIKKYGKEGATSYLFHKTGKRAGQSVPHWHEHVILPNSAGEETYGRFKVFYNIIFGVSPLKSEELKQRVTALREELSP